MTVTTTPPGTRADMIDAALRISHAYELGTVAASFAVTLNELQAVLRTAGYPDQVRMARAATQLRAHATSHVGPVAPDEADAEPGDQRLVNVAVGAPHPDPNNLRDHTGDVAELADSIRAVGLLQPIVARRDGDRLVVVAGHRRLAALQTLRWTHVDVIVRAPMRPDHVIAAMLIENGQRRDLDAIEEARGIRQLMVDHKLATHDRVAKLIGRSQPYVSSRLALLELTPEQQDQVRAGELGITSASNLSRLQSGRTRKSSKGHVTVAYFGPTNDLATRAKARCDRLDHRGRIAGGMACGGCWESVIRADERNHAQTLTAERGQCVTCDNPVER